jgi:hypothetical protein
MNQLEGVTQHGQWNKYTQLLDNMKIMDKSKWVRCQDPRLADEEIRELAESFIVRKLQFMDSANIT